MDLHLAEKDRWIIPRWRDFRTTCETGELDDGGLDGVQPVEAGVFFEEKVENWKANRSIETAADLVASAWVLSRAADASDAAQFLVEHGQDTTPSVRSIAEALLGSPTAAGAAFPPPSGGATVDMGVLRIMVRTLRAELNDSPRNAILWVDLARAYTMLGQKLQSIRAMDRAVKLAPGNRFVLRSAARLFVHAEEPDRADDLLRRNSLTRHDPWLLAAEIAVASVASRTSPFIRVARQMLTGSRRPSETTELTSALATLQMSAGESRKARQMFRDSLVDPTENAVAQVGWASRRISGLELDPRALATPRSFEARAWEGFQSGDWSTAIANCGEWLLDEPFSSRPAEFGSYLAGVAQDDYPLSEDFARRGLVANPGETILLNNLVVALANQGKLEEAEQLFSAIERSGITKRIEAALLATEGLLRFRRGDPKGGREHYLAAIITANEPSLRRTRAMAALHLLREELIAGSPDLLRDVAIAERECAGVDDADVAWMWKRLRGKFGS